MWDDFDWDDSVGDYSNDYNAVTESSGNWYNSFPDFNMNFGSISDTGATDNSWNLGNLNYSDVADFDFLPETAPVADTSWLNALPSLGDAPMASTGTAGTASGISNVLSQIFNNVGAPLAMKGVAALYEGNQNKKKASALGNVAQQIQQVSDPFSSQRPIYQQQLQQTVTNPYSSPMVKAQVDNIARAQAIKDAAAGRRSNSLASAPGVLAAQADIAQKYMNSLGPLAGANMSPNTQAISQLLSQKTGYDTQGYGSPLAYLMSDEAKNIQNQDLMGQIKSLINKG